MPQQGTLGRFPEASQGKVPASWLAETQKHKKSANVKAEGTHLLLKPNGLSVRKEKTIILRSDRHYARLKGVF